LGQTASVWSMGPQRPPPQAAARSAHFGAAAQQYRVVDCSVPAASPIACF
jgi:hypothetical protein